MVSRVCLDPSSIIIEDLERAWGPSCQIFCRQSFLQHFSSLATIHSAHKSWSLTMRWFVALRCSAATQCAYSISQTAVSCWGQETSFVSFLLLWMYHTCHLLCLNSDCARFLAWGQLLYASFEFWARTIISLVSYIHFDSTIMCCFSTTSKFCFSVMLEGDTTARTEL